MRSWAAIGVGASLIAVGLLFIRWHAREWREEKNDPRSTLATACIITPAIAGE